MIHLILDSTSGVGADFLAHHPNVHCISPVSYTHLTLPTTNL